MVFLYPNPTPKRRQANQRFFVGAQFQLLNSRLKTKGQITLATNIKDYKDEALDHLQKLWGYHVLSDRSLPSDFKARTAFEKKYQEQGQKLYELIVKKSGDTPKTWFPLVFEK
ncbi:MAG: hypothetical protein H7A33_00920 [Deltaproteobacteria bacterium]|nr:hypothetical protein [Deltaproteobacteria bacterium]